MRVLQRAPAASRQRPLAAWLAPGDPQLYGTNPGMAGKVATKVKSKLT